MTPREDAAVKAARLLTLGRLSVTEVTDETIRGTCRGDHDTYELGAVSSVLVGCSCPTRGTRCSHLIALRLVILHHTTKSSPQPAQ